MESVIFHLLLKGLPATYAFTQITKTLILVQIIVAIGELFFSIQSFSQLLSLLKSSRFSVAFSDFLGLRSSISHLRQTVIDTIQRLLGYIICEF